VELNKMNERIKQLLIQSGFRVFGEKIVAGDFGSSGNATLCSQKFAELIVKECATFAMHSMDKEAMKKHFGVEE